MKKLALVIAFMFLMGGMVYADEISVGGLWDTALEYITERPVKAGFSYDIDNDKIVGTVGTAVVEDIFGVKRLDIDLLLSGDDLDVFNDDNKIISGGASYHIKLTQDSEICLGASAGTKRIENFNDLGEIKALVSILWKHKI